MAYGSSKYVLFDYDAYTYHHLSEVRHYGLGVGILFFYQYESKGNSGSRIVRIMDFRMSYNIFYKGLHHHPVIMLTTNKKAIF